MISILTTARIVAKKYKKTKATFTAEAALAIRESTVRVHQDVARNRFIRAPHAASADVVVSRTGTALRALFSKLPATSDQTPEGRVGFNLAKAKYMRLIEKGGEVVAKNVRNLTIPIGDALTGNGVARFTARELIANPESFGYTGTFFRRHVLFGKEQGKGIAPLFALKPRVTIQGRHPLANALKANLTWIRERIRVAGLRAAQRTVNG